MPIDTSLGPFSPSFEPIPNGPITDPNTGVMTGWWRNHLEGGRTRNGEIISGINRNRQNIIQLETDYTAADGVVSSAYISADAVVASDAEGARAALFTTLTTAYEAADATLQADINTRATVTELTTAESTLEGSIAGQYTTITAEYTAITDTKARTFSQPTPPTATATGDLWIDTDDDNKLYRWSGSAWVAMPDARIATNAASITTEQTARADADTAIATDVTNLTATVTTIGSDLDTAEAAIVTNAASITTEQSARASGDSANASSISTLEASVETHRDDQDAVNWSDVAHIWDWASGTPGGWAISLASASYPAAGGIQLTAPASPAGPDVYIRSPPISVLGSRYYKVVIDCECVSGAGGTTDLRLFWQTGSHGESASHQDKPRNETAFTNGERRLLVYDMESPSAGGDDWVTNTITRIRFDLPQNANSVYIVHSIKIVGVNTITALAQVTTNAAAITTEQNARASGDSANATSITTLTAKVRGEIMPERVSVAEDFTHYTLTYAASELTDGTQTTVDNEGVVRQFAETDSAGNGLGNRSPIKILPGATYEARARARVTVDATTATNRMAIGFRVFASSGTYLGLHGFVTAEAVFDVSDGWIERAITATYSAVVAAFPTAAYMRPILCVNRRADTGALNNATTQVAFLRLSDETLSAQVKNIAEAYATDSGSTARLVWTVNTGTNAATIEQTAHEGYADGTWNGSAISLTADEITLDGDVIVTGSLTTTQLAANAVSSAVEQTVTGETLSLSNNVWLPVCTLGALEVGAVAILRWNLWVTHSIFGGFGAEYGQLRWRVRRNGSVTLFEGETYYSFNSGQQVQTHDYNTAPGMMEDEFDISTGSNVYSIEVAFDPDEVITSGPTRYRSANCTLKALGFKR